MITAARMAIRSQHAEFHSFTAGMLAVLLATTLWFPQIGEEIIDPATRFAGANLSDALQHTLTVVACYAWVASTVTADCPRRGLWYWRGATLATITAMIATYLASDRFATPGEEFSAHDPASRAHNWLWTVYMLISFLMLLRAALAQPPSGGVDYRVSRYLVMFVAAVGITAGAATTALLATHPHWLADHYRTLAGWCVIPAMIALGGAGIPGLIQAWQARDDPRS